MIRLLYRCGVDPDSPLRWLLYPDPEMLATIEAEAGRPDFDPVAAAANFSRVVSSIRIGRVHKLTRGDRLAEANRNLGELLAAGEPQDIQLLDVGGSDGTTTLDTLRHLESVLTAKVHVTLMDRYIRLERRGSGWVREYRMSDGSPVMLRLGPIGVQLSSIDTTRNPLSRWIGRTWLARAERRDAMPMTLALILISPAVRAAGIRVVEWDAMQRNPELAGGFDVVRASNVLNENYFSRQQIELALSHLHTYLRPDGLLLVSRNHLEPEGEVEHGSVWRRSARGFDRLRDYGGGSYIATIVDELRVETPSERAGG